MFRFLDYYGSSYYSQKYYVDPSREPDYMDVKKPHFRLNPVGGSNAGTTSSRMQVGDEEQEDQKSNVGLTAADAGARGAATAAGSRLKQMMEGYQDNDEGGSAPTRPTASTSSSSSSSSSAAATASSSSTTVDGKPQCVECGHAVFAYCHDCSDHFCLLCFQASR